MRKQSSIEYLVKELENLTQIEFDGIGKPIIEHAELLHKLEIQRAFLKNDNSVSIDYALERFEKYYNETFKTK